MHDVFYSLDDQELDKSFFKGISNPMQHCHQTNNNFLLNSVIQL